jgi:formylglycine-generating enzyme required for sulfatase activity
MTVADNFGTSMLASTFAKLLQSFKEGVISYDDFLALIDQHLAEGASAGQLIKILLDSEAVSPLSPDVHEALVDRIASSTLTLVEPPVHSVDAPTLVLHEEGSGAGRMAVPRDATRAPVAGAILRGRFQLVELIGEGGMSRVYKALDLRRLEAGSDEPYIAVKILTLPFHEYFGSIAALQSEAQKLQGLAHPNIVRVFDCDRDGETVFMTMEYLAGTRLLAGDAQSAALRSPGERDARAIILAIANALDYAHRNNIVHGDLKPGNVIVPPRGEVKVIDFGLARWIAHPGSGAAAGRDSSSKVALAATQRYASPQVMARQVPEPADDVYALACIAYQLLTGVHPFDDDEALVSRRAPPQRRGATSGQHAAIIQALQFERRDRTATVRQFIEQFSAAPLHGGRWQGFGIGWAAAALLVLLAWFFGHRFVPTEPASMPSAAQPVLVAPIAVRSAGTVIRDCPTCPFMTVLPRGRFQQGSESSVGAASFEHPKHWVSIDYLFAMSTNAVTVGEFQEFVTATGRDMQGCDVYDGEWRHRPDASWVDPGFTQGTSHPVTCVSWNDALAYAKWLSAATGHRYRLPSASEWEYASRARRDEMQPWNASPAAACTDANVADQRAAHRYPGWTVFPCDDGYVNTAPVGSFKANGFGLNDMLGNVFQWTQDCWTKDYTGAPADGAARLDGDCTEHEMRGGSWFSSPSYVSAAYRNHFAANYRTSSVGFRLVRDLEP